MQIVLTSAVAVWLLLGVSSGLEDDATIDICKGHGWSKIAAHNRLFIVSPNRPTNVANSNMNCSCKISPTVTTADNGSSNGTTRANPVSAVNVSIRATVLVLNKLQNDPERCWASLSTSSSSSSFSSSSSSSSSFSPSSSSFSSSISSSSSAPNETALLLCPQKDLMEEELVTYTLNRTSEAFVLIEFRREELHSEDPVATFILSIYTAPEVDLSVSCSEEVQPPVTHSEPTLKPGFTVNPGTKQPSSNGSDVVSKSRGGQLITTGWPDTAITDGSERGATTAGVDRNNTVSGRASEQMTTTTNQVEPKGGNEESLEYYKVKVIAISVGVASVVFILLIVFMAYEIITHRRRANQQNRILSNDSIAPHRPDALCLPYTEPDVDSQWWPISGGCSSPSAASWPGTEFVGTSSAQCLPDSAFIGPQTLPRSCTNRPPIPIPVLQVQMYAGQRASKANGTTASTFYDVIDLPQSNTPRNSTYNESEPDLAATAAVAALSESGRMTVDYSDYEFPDNISPAYTDMGQGRRGKDKPAFVLPLTTCYLTAEEVAGDGHLPTNRSNTSVEDNIDQQQQQPEPAYEEPRLATYDNPVATTSDEGKEGDARMESFVPSSSPSLSSSSTSSSSSVLSPDCDHYDHLPPFKNRVGLN